MTRYARHLQQRTIVNPFQGLPRLEAAIGRRIVSRIGSNESMPIAGHPLATQWGEALYELARLYPDPYATAIRERAATLNGVDAANVVVDAGADSLIALFLRARVSPGDVVVFNDPYQGGMHLPDIFMFRPVFVGDDVTDEDGFAEAMRHGGLAITVGPRDSRLAAYGLADPAAVHHWLGL